MSLSLNGRLSMSGRINVGYYDEQHSPYYKKLDSCSLGILYDLFYETKNDPGNERLAEIIEECGRATAVYSDADDMRQFENWKKWLNGTPKEREGLPALINTCIGGAIYMACEDDYILDQVPYASYIRAWVKNGCRPA